MIKPETVKRFKDLVEAAEMSGQEPIEVLARWGQLRREKEDGVEALVRCYRTLEAADGANVLKTMTGKSSGTPADMFRAVMLWFERYIEEKEREK